MPEPAATELEQAKVTELEQLKGSINERAYKTLEKAREHSRAWLSKGRSTIDGYLVEQGLDPDLFCFVAVGSVGREEALEASDFDVVPILRKRNRQYSEDLDPLLRDRLRESLGIKVSKGHELTKPTTLERLSAADTIGGNKDTSFALTRRVLLLSEGRQVGGDLRLDDARRILLKAYGGQERTSGRHVLSLCNDLARYYRQLCIDYKAKVDVDNKDWSTRNMKLRHSRKFWYFSTLMGIVARSASVPREREMADGFSSLLLEVMADSPALRLASAVPPHLRTALSPILKSYAFFLQFMAEAENRYALARVRHSKRYEPRIDNPFPALKANSDVMHRAMINLLEAVDVPIRHRVLDWFLL